MPRDPLQTTVSLKPADMVFLSWATGINASGMFREALTEQMAYRDINRNELSELVEEALAQDGRDLDDLCEQTSSMADLETLIEGTVPDD